MDEKVILLLLVLFMLQTTSKPLLHVGSVNINIGKNKNKR